MNYKDKFTFLNRNYWYNPKHTETNLKAFSREGTERYFWTTPGWKQIVDIQFMVVPKVIVQNVFLARGSGSKLQNINNYKKYIENISCLTWWGQRIEWFGFASKLWIQNVAQRGFQGQPNKFMPRFIWMLGTTIEQNLSLIGFIVFAYPEHTPNTSSFHTLLCTQ